MTAEETKANEAAAAVAEPASTPEAKSAVGNGAAALGGGAAAAGGAAVGAVGFVGGGAVDVTKSIGGGAAAATGAVASGVLESTKVVGKTLAISLEKAGAVAITSLGSFGNFMAKTGPVVGAGLREGVIQVGHKTVPAAKFVGNSMVDGANNIGAVTVDAARATGSFLAGATKVTGHALVDATKHVSEKVIDATLFTGDYVAVSAKKAGEHIAEVSGDVAGGVAGGMAAGLNAGLDAAGVPIAVRPIGEQLSVDTPNGVGRLLYLRDADGIAVVDLGYAVGYFNVACLTPIIVVKLRLMGHAILNDRGGYTPEPGLAAIINLFTPEQSAQEKVNVTDFDQIKIIVRTPAGNGRLIGSVRLDGILTVQLPFGVAYCHYSNVKLD